MITTTPMSLTLELIRHRGWMRVFKERGLGIHLYAGTEIAEVIAGTIALGWGFIFLLPFDTFHTGPQNQVATSYRVLYDWVGGREWVVGGVFLTLGLLQLICLLLDNQRGRRYSALIGVFVWSVICIAFWLADPRQTNFVTYAPVAVACAFTYLRVREI